MTIENVIDQFEKYLSENGITEKKAIVEAAYGVLHDKPAKAGGVEWWVSEFKGTKTFVEQFVETAKSLSVADKWATDYENGVAPKTVEEISALFVEYLAANEIIDPAKIVVAAYDVLGGDLTPKAGGVAWWVGQKLTPKALAAEFIKVAGTLEKASKWADEIESGEGEPGEPGEPSSLTEALVKLAEANQNVADKQTEIDEFLKATVSNDFVKAVQSVAASITAADLNTALVNAAGEVQTEASTAVKLTGTAAQQAAQINAARVDHQAAIDNAQTDVNDAAKKLETGVAAKVELANGAAADLTAALKAVDEKTTAENDKIAIAKVVVKGDLPPDGAAFAVVNTAPSEAINVGVGTDTVVFTKFENGKFVIDATKAVLANGVYTIAGTSETDKAVTIEQAYLNDLVAAANAKIVAVAGKETAEKNMADAFNAVLNAQDPEAATAYAFDYAALSTTGAASGNGAIKVDGTTKAVTLDWDGDHGSAAATIVGTGSALTDLVTYAGEVTALNTATENKAAFEKALTDWEAVNTLVQDHKALDQEKKALDAVALEAKQAITNAEDADPAGLGVTLVDADASADVAFTAANEDLYLFNAEDLGATNTEISIAEFTGEDQIFFGDAFTGGLVGIEKVADNNGALDQLDIFWLQNGADVELYVEQKTFAGNGSGNADLVKIELAGVNGEDLSFEDGFLTIA